MKSKRYCKDICELFLQNFNFKGNTLDKLDVQKEIFPLVKQAIESYPEELQHRNIDLIKSSLDRSYYASQNDTLLSYYTDQLINHNDDSFLVVPTGFKTRTGAHEVSCIIKKLVKKFKGYGTDISNYLREQYKMYCYLKDDRNKYPEDIKVMRKIENGKILNKHFTNSIPEFKRVASYNIEASLNNNKKKNLLSRFKKFIKLEGTKVRANQLTKEEITVIRSNVNDIRKNLEKDKEKINRNFNNIKEKALTMSMFIEPNVSRGSVRNSSIKNHNVRE